MQQLEVCRECQVRLLIKYGGNAAATVMLYNVSCPQDMLGLLNERRKVEKDYIHKVRLQHVGFPQLGLLMCTS